MQVIQLPQNRIEEAPAGEASSLMVDTISRLFYPLRILPRLSFSFSVTWTVFRPSPRKRQKLAQDCCVRCDWKEQKSNSLEYPINWDISRISGIPKNSKLYPGQTRRNIVLHQGDLTMKKANLFRASSDYGDRNSQY